MQKNINISSSKQESKKKKLSDTDPIEQNEIQDIEIPDFSTLNKEELVKFVENAKRYTSPLSIAKSVSEAKFYFEEILQNEQDEALNKFLEEGNNVIDFTPKPEPLKSQFTGFYKEFRKKCNQLKEDIHNSKKENLEKKLMLIEELKTVTEEAENQHSYQKFKQIQAKWRRVGFIPPAEIDNIWNTYNYYVNKFYDQLTLHSELKELDRKKNLEVKNELIKRAYLQIEEEDIEKASEHILKIQSEWRYTGPVPAEHSDKIQIEFQNIITKFYEKQQLHKEEIEALREKNFEAKLALVENINQLTELKSDKPSEWVQKDKKLTELIELWKEIGMVPSHKVNLIRKQFHDAIKTFKTAKNSFFSELKKIRSNNLKEKRNICDEIEAITTKEDFFNYKNEIFELQSKWKNSGQVPKNKIEKIREHFQSVCDNYFKKLTEYNEKQQDKYKENLIKKEALIKELEKMISNDEKITDPEKFVIDIQKKWIDLGFVPIKKKQEINQKFNQVLQKLINTVSSEEFNINPELLKFKVKVESILNNSDPKTHVKSEIKKLRLQYELKKEEIKSIENNIELFNFKSNEGKKLKANLDSKISNIKKSMELIDEKIAIIRQVPKI